VQVEVRKKRVLVKRDTPEVVEVPVVPVEASVVVPEPVVEVAPPVVEIVPEPVVEAVVDVAPVVEVAPEPEPAPEPVVVETVAPVVEATPAAPTEEKPKVKTTRMKKASFLDEKELAVRKAEEDRYAQLRARQEQDRIDRENREKELIRLREEAAAKQAALKVAEETRKAATTAAQTAPEERREAPAKDRDDRDGRRGKSGGAGRDQKGNAPGRGGNAWKMGGKKGDKRHQSNADEAHSLMHRPSRLFVKARA
jgi:translation initiation factor IF-2